MALELILRELRSYELSLFWQLFCAVECGVCVINSSYSFSANVTQTLQTYCGCIEDVHVGFGLS